MSPNETLFLESTNKIVKDGKNKEPIDLSSSAQVCQITRYFNYPDRKLSS